MTHPIKREITKEQYERVTMHNDAKGIFTESEMCGYGVYCDRYFEENGKYYVEFVLGSTCD